MTSEPGILVIVDYKALLKSDEVDDLIRTLTAAAALAREAGTDDAAD